MKPRSKLAIFCKNFRKKRLNFGFLQGLAHFGFVDALIGPDNSLLRVKNFREF